MWTQLSIDWICSKCDFNIGLLWISISVYHLKLRHYSLLNQSTSATTTLVKLLFTWLLYLIEYWRCVAVCQVMAKGIFAFFAAHTPSTLNTIKSYSTTFRMPFVTSGMAVNTSRQEVGYELYLRPLYARALVDIIRHYDWKEIWYIYNNNEGDLELTSVELAWPQLILLECWFVV